MIRIQVGLLDWSALLSRNRRAALQSGPSRHNATPFTPGEVDSPSDLPHESIPPRLKGVEPMVIPLFYDLFASVERLPRPSPQPKSS